MVTSGKRTRTSFKIEVSGDAESKTALLTRIQQVKGMLGFGTTNLTAFQEVLIYWLNNHPHQHSTTSNTEQEPTSQMDYHSLTEEEAKAETLIITGHKALSKLTAMCNHHGTHCRGSVALASSPNNTFGFYNKFAITCAEGAECSVYTMENGTWSNSSYLPNGKSHVNKKIMHGYFTSRLLPSQLDTFIDGCGIASTRRTMKYMLQREDYLNCIEQVDGIYIVLFSSYKKYGFSGRNKTM